MILYSIVFYIQILYYLYKTHNIQLLTISFIINTILKNIFRVERKLPKEHIETGWLSHPISKYLGFHYALPSGHSQLTTTIFLHYPTPIMGLMTIIVILQRYIDGFHTPLQIISGIFVAVLIKLIPKLLSNNSYTNNGRTNTV